MVKLDLEKAEEPNIKLSTSVGSQKEQEDSRKTSTSVSLTLPKPLTEWITTNWKILQEMGIRDHLTCLLRNLYTGQAATVRTRYGMTDWFKIGKGVIKAVYCYPAYLTYMQSEVKWSESHSVVSNSLQSLGLYSSWNSPYHNTEVGSLSILLRILPTQGSNPGLPHYRWILYQLSHKRSPICIVHHVKCQDGWSTSWNQECWERY